MWWSQQLTNPGDLYTFSNTCTGAAVVDDGRTEAEYGEDAAWLL
jgi:hypothetical protein